MKRLSMMLGCMALAGAASAQTLVPREPGRKVMVVAHRACWEGGAPEVSVAAIRACDAIRPDMVEVDVRKTRDGQFVLMHDDTVDRTTDGTGRVADLTAAQIRALRLRAGNGGPTAPLTGEHVPTLEQGLRAAMGRFLVNLHLYVDPEPAIGAIVRRMGMAGKATTWVTGDADAPALTRFPMQGTVIPIPIIRQCAAVSTEGCWAKAGSLMDYAPYRPAGFYVIPAGKVSSDKAHDFIREAAAAARPAGTRIMISTLFDVDALPPEALRAEWRRQIALGADFIMTDHPTALLDLLRVSTR